MFGNLTGWHFLILLVIVLLIFGATRLPALAKSLGQSTKILRDELKDGAKDGTSATVDPAASRATPAESVKPTESTSSGSDTRS
ncbi:MAG: twin-arginine translocase TatA/TatE family subunit [Micrococcales bacterium]|nr:twin-arginine translocase TatA/TatE family subunit [Micrococcales bacterium]